MSNGNAPGVQAWPPADRPFNYANATPMVDTHPSEHNSVSLAINDLVTRVQELEAVFDDNQNGVHAGIRPQPVGGQIRLDSDDAPYGRMGDGSPTLGRYLCQTVQRVSESGTLNSTAYTFGEFPNAIEVARPDNALVVVHWTLRLIIPGQIAGAGPQGIEVEMRRRDSPTGNSVALSTPAKEFEIYSPVDNSGLTGGVPFYGSVAGTFVVPNPAELNGKYLILLASTKDGTSNPVTTFIGDGTEATLVVSQ